MSHSVFNIIRRPLISEKGSRLIEKLSCYPFEVATGSNKYQIRKAVEELFHVRVLQVRTMIVHRESKRVGRFQTQPTNWKKAFVTIEKGQKIEIFHSKVGT